MHSAGGLCRPAVYANVVGSGSGEEVQRYQEESLMSDSAIFIGWGNVIPGREAKSLAVFGEVIEYYTRLKSQGDVESFEAFALDPHGGDLAGFLIVRGDAEKLSQLRRSDDFIRLDARAGLVVQNFGVVGAVTGERLNSHFQLYLQQTQELT